MTTRLSGREILRTSLFISFPVIALDQFLRTTPANLAAQPAVQAQHWVTGALMALPLFAAACWAGDLVAARAAISPRGRMETMQRSLMISLFCVVFLTPVWFGINKNTNPLTSQPLVFPHARDSGDVYTVPSAVVVALVCVCLVPAAFWLGRAVPGRLPGQAPRRLAATAIPLLLVAAVPVAAWLLYRVSGHAYASQVYITVRGTAVRPAPFATGLQIAHAVQDGLAGQAAGFAVMCFGVLPRAASVSRKADGPRHPRPGPAGISAGGPAPTATEEAPE